MRPWALEYFVSFAERNGPKIDSLEALQWFPRLEAEFSNFGTALEWGLDHNVAAGLRLVGALAAFWYRHGHTVDGINWTTEALARAEQLPHLAGEAARQQTRIQANAWQAMASLAYLNDNPAALRAAEMASRLARELGDTSLLAINLAVAGMTRVQLGDPAGAHVAIEESLAIARRSGEKYSLGIALTLLAQYCSLVQHDFQAARAYEEEGLALLSSNPTSWGAINAFSAAARNAMLRGDYPTARARFTESLPLFQQIGDAHRLTMIDSELAHMDRYEGRYPQAAAAYRGTIRAWQKLGHRGAIAHQLESFAFVAKAQGQQERAARLLGAAAGLREKINNPMSPQERVEYDRELADLRARLGQENVRGAVGQGPGTDPGSRD